MALPIIALQHHKVKIHIRFGEHVTDASLWMDYVYLDNEERKLIAESDHHMLVTHVQQRNAHSHKISLDFSNPCKELIWKTDTPYETATLLFNNHERMAPREMKYFQIVQPHQHHTRVPDNHKNISVYSFSLDPENEYQPSGTCNFSKIDDTRLILDGGNVTRITLWALTWNILKISGGEGMFEFSS